MATSEPLPGEGAALSLEAGDVAEALAKRNPGVSAAEIDEASRIVASLSEAVLSLSGARRRSLLTGQDGLFNVIHDVEAALSKRPSPSRIALSPTGAVERPVGAGLGERLDARAGPERLAAYAGHRGIGDWAGPVAGPDEVAARFGVTRATLRGWQRARAVIELSGEAGDPVFPWAQFAGGRPLPGLAELQNVVGDARTAWLWLDEAESDGSASRLESLKRGDVEEVLDAARDDFA